MMKKKKNLSNKSRQISGIILEVTIHSQINYWQRHLSHSFELNHILNVSYCKRNDFST